MEAGKMTCTWDTCDGIIQPKQGKGKFVKCEKCRHMNCPQCRASHEGVNCATYQAQRQPASSPPRSSSAGGRSPGGGSYSPGPNKNHGGSASPKGLSSPPKPSRPSLDGACQGPRSACAPSAGAATSRPEAPQQPALGGAKKKVLYLIEGCGYDVWVDANATELACYKCRHTTCLRCNATHGDLSREKYQREKAVEGDDDIRVNCAKPGCPFTAFVGLSVQQVTCTICGQITSLHCHAVHEFKTCQDYKSEGCTSNGEQAAPEREQHSAGTAQALPNGRPSPGAESEPTSRPPAAAAAASAAIKREAARLQESLVGHAPDEEGHGQAASGVQTSPKSNASPNQTQPVPKRPPAKNEGAAQQTRPVTTTLRGTHEPAARPEAVMLECSSCLAEAPYDELVEVAPCTHFLCRECVRTSGVRSLTYIVHCPVKSEEGDCCQSQIQESALRSAMSRQEYDRHKELLPLTVVRCPVEGCRGKFSIRPGVESVECASCQTEYCVACSANHPGRTCRQFIDTILEGDAVLMQDREAPQQPASGGAKEIVFCATEGCGYEVMVDANATELPCYKCRRSTCLRCNATHGNLSCEVNQREKAAKDEDKIRVHCAKPGCPFTTFVGVSMLQVTCTTCEQITCLRCEAVHEFKTCEEYEKERRTSSGAQATREREQHSSGTAHIIPKRRSSLGAESEPTPRPPAAATAARAAMAREASQLHESLVRQAPDEAPQQPASGGAKKIVFCATEGCGYEVMVDANATELPCYKCRRSTCLRCNATHGNLSCEQYQREKAAEDEDEIRVYCAKPGCPFTTFVGVSMLRVTCTICGQITCLRCQAVHEFKTCEEYEKERCTSSGAQAAPESDQQSAGAAHALRNRRWWWWRKNLYS